MRKTKDNIVICPCELRCKVSHTGASKQVSGINNNHIFLYICFRLITMLHAYIKTNQLSVTIGCILHHFPLPLTAFQ